MHLVIVHFVIGILALAGGGGKTFLLLWEKAIRVSNDRRTEETQFKLQAREYPM